MIEVYDYDNAHLFLDNGSFKFDLQLRPPYTAIDGDSATGKTMLAKSIIKYNELVNKEGQTTNIRAFLRGMKIKDIEDADRSLIVMDNAVNFMTVELSNYIRWDRRNHYLFMTRLEVGVDIPPNHWGEFFNDKDNVIRIYYDYNKPW